MRTTNRRLCRIGRKIDGRVPAMVAAIIVMVWCTGINRASAGEVDVRLVALTGEPAPGTEYVTVFWLFTNALNHSMMHPAIDDEGQVAFQGSLLDADGSVQYSALVMTDDDGALHKIVAVGDQFDVHGDGSDVREVVRIVSGGLSDTGDLVFRLDFTTDGLESGHFVARIGDQAYCMADLVDGALFQPPDDRVVDGADLAFLLGEWGANPGSPADMITSATLAPPPDDVVDGADLAMLLSGWGECE